MTRASRRKRKLERRKRGRPLVLDPAPRTSNGRKSMARIAVARRTQETERETMEVAVKARMRATGLPEPMARQPFAGSVLGLLRFDGKISETQFEAGNRYAEDMARYYGLTGIPFPSAKSQALFQVIRTTGEDSEARIAAARVASNRMMVLENILATCSNHPNAPKSCCMAACILNDMSARNWPEGTMRYLKLGLSGLARFYSGGK